MSIFRLFILLVISLLVQGDIHFNISSCQAYSKKAFDLCELATPSIIFRDTRQDVNISLPINESLWVGYVRDYASFTYKGCAYLSRLSFKKNTTHIRADPGHCYSYCDTLYIGVRKYHYWDYCYCIDAIQDDIDLNQSCSTTCDFPNGTLCGGQNHLVSVYKYVHNETYSASNVDVNGTEGQCLAYSGMEIVWRFCYEVFGILCQNGSEIVRSSVFKNWTESQQFCINGSYLPVDFEANLSSIQINETTWWLGTIRSFSIFNSSSVSKTENVRQGYISKAKNDNNITLQFGIKNESLRGLCKGGDNSLDKKEKQEGQNLVAVYVVIPLALLIAAVVAAFLIWRKRKKAKETDEGTAEYHETKPSRVRTHNAVANAAYQDDHRINVSSKENLRHDYLVLEPQNEYSSISDGDLENKDSGEYDTTNTLSLTEQQAGKETCNVYNKLQDVVDDPYNHTSTSSMNTEDTYNHTGNEESAYNTTDTLPQGRHGLAGHESENNGANNFDDTYNHGSWADTPNDTYNHVEGTLSNAKLNANVDDTYNHPENKMVGAKKVAESYTYIKPMPTRPPPRPDDRKQTDDYAYATEDSRCGSAEPAR